MDTHSLGLYLQNARQERGLSLDDVVHAIKVRRRILESFEQGDFNPNISPVHVRGFLRTYAAFLGLDEDLILQYYESATEPKKGRRKRKQRPPTRPTRQEPIPIDSGAVRDKTFNDTSPTSPTNPYRPDSIAERQSKRRRRRSRLLNFLLGILLVVISLTVILVGMMQFLQGSDSDDLIPDDVVSQLSETPVPTIAPTFTLSANTVNLPEFQQDFDGRGVALTIQNEQRTWIRIVVDGIEQFATVVAPGEVLNFRATREIIMQAANAGGLVVFYNGQLQGSYGERGQEVEVQYLHDAINILVGNLPSPTPFPTNTSAPTDENIPTVTHTVIPSNTPLPSPTPLPGTGNSDTDSATNDEPSNTPESGDSQLGGASSTPVPTATDVATLEPTAVLPPRNTPSNPTPTKSVP